MWGEDKAEELSKRFKQEKKFNMKQAMCKISPVRTYEELEHMY
jgi:hypothetical protein